LVVFVLQKKQLFFCSSPIFWFLILFAIYTTGVFSIPKQHLLLFVYSWDITLKHSFKKTKIEERLTCSKAPNSSFKRDMFCKQQTSYS